MPDRPYRIGFIGAGKMATALAKGWLKAGLLNATSGVAYDPHAATASKFAAETGLKIVSNNAAVLEAADILIPAVKPQVLPAVLHELRSFVESRHLVVSIAAGVTLSQLMHHLSAETRIVRVMPNTPTLVGAGAAGYSAGPAATPEDLATTQKLFGSVGIAYQLPESQLDGLTGLSGSGPAFIFVVIEALADAGVRVGLARETALKLAAQTVLGSAKMVLETGEHPASLKDDVASPGGTTIAGLHALERGALRATLMNAVEAAANRAAELGRKS